MLMLIKIFIAMFGFHIWTKYWCGNSQYCWWGHLRACLLTLNSKCLSLFIFFYVKIEASIFGKEKPCGLIICPFYSCTYILFTWTWFEIPGTLDPHYCKEIIMPLIRVITIVNTGYPIIDVLKFWIILGNFKSDLRLL